MIGKVAIAAALRGLNDRTFGDPYIFFPETDYIYSNLHIVQK